jgi:hypothetical protein
MKKGKAALHREETGDTVYYAEKWDAYACQQCDEWLENCCDDPECSFCPTRPATPSDDKVIL